ncbi:MAG: TldD/PmbA family protein [Candidatus Bipolaricaulaceae bacterium]
MEAHVREVLAKAKADYAEVRWEKVFHSQVVYQRDQLMNLEASREAGGVARALVGGAWGVAVFTDLDQLAAKVAEAARIARAAAQHVKDPIELAPAEQVRDHYSPEMKQDFRQVPLEEKRKLTWAYNKLILEAFPQIASTAVRYVDELRHVVYANSEGTYVEQEIPDVSVLLSAVARKNGDIQRGFESTGAAAGFEVAQGLEEKAMTAAKRAVALLSAKPVKGGHYTVILDQELAGVFIHEAFGHICEADFLLRNEPMRRVLRVGKQFGTAALNVVDDGFVAGARGNAPYDDEGVPRRKIYLIREGVLEGLMHSRATAWRTGMEPTGNARAVSWEHPPIVRMRNTYIEPGEASFADLLAGVDRGIYACGAFGGQTELEQFTFSAAYAYEIRGGEIGDMVRDVVLTGNVFHTLKNIELIGDDFQLKGGAGGCGKDDQFPLPVTHGAPHVRIGDVTVGGS